MTNRRTFLQASAGAFGSLVFARNAGAAIDTLDASQLPAGAQEAMQLFALPGKRALIKKTFRPPNFETPTQYFESLYTPNDAFFVRYHLANIPVQDEAQWRLTIGGDAAGQAYALSLSELKSQFESVELSALCMCSGNRRGLFKPPVPGVEWGHGAMGNARWRGVRLKDVLARAGVGKLALEVAFDGADTGVLPATPDFRKSLPIWKAMDDNTLIAYEMNGEPLPHWNGFPVRLVVPGWTATYWMKHLSSIEVIAKPFDNFWTKTAYRVPNGKFPLVERFTSQETDVNTPITEMVVNSLVTNMSPGTDVGAGEAFEVKGVAWDGGYGITRVELSQDNGETWRMAQLDTDVGRFSWRQWRTQIALPRGEHTLMVRASNRVGATQPFELIANPAGYHHNVVQRVTVRAQ